MEIKGRTFLVTGGAQGMGRCFVEELSKLGAHAIFCDINEVGIAEVEQACADHEGTVRGMVVNVAEPDTVTVVITLGGGAAADANIDAELAGSVFINV